MTEENKPTEQANTRQALAGRLLLKLVWLLVFLFGLFSATVIWLSTTESGARSALPMLGKMAGIQFQGISGNLMHTLHVRQIVMQNKGFEFAADDVELQWQPVGLLKRQILLDSLRVNNLDLAMVPGDAQSAILPTTLQLPDSIKLVRADSVGVRQFRLSDLDANRQRVHPLQFSALEGKLEISPLHYVLKLDGVTPWGTTKLDGELGSARPFELRAKIDWTGLAINENDITFPKAKLTGTVSGNLSRLNLEAQLATLDPVNDVNVKSRQTAKPMDGQIQAIFTPFSTLPIDTFKLNFTGVNPAGFYKAAPKANLQLTADFHVSGDGKSPVLRGHLSAENAEPFAWNFGGIPVVKLSTALALSEHEVSWQKARIEFEQSGVAVGEGRYSFPDSGKKQLPGRITLPDVGAQFELSNVNVLRIDSRLKKTQLSGKIEVQNRDSELRIDVNLQEADPALHAHLLGEINLNDQLTLRLQNLSLSAKDASLTANGSIGLRDEQAFHLDGQARNFNPARWIAVPDGHIATHFKVAGQLERGWRIDAQVSQLAGQFAGLDLHGESDLFAQQGKLLSIKKLELNWGKNHLSAHGNWQLQEHLNTTQHEQMQFALAVPDLSALSKPFEKIVPIALQGSIFADGELTGNAAQPAGTFNVNADQLAIPDIIYARNLQANVTLENGEHGKIEGKVVVSGVANSALNLTDERKFKIEELQASVSGLRHAHTLQMTARLPQKQQVELRGTGDLQEANAHNQTDLHWVGKILALNLTGPVDFQLQSPFGLTLSTSSAQMGEANWQGKLGNLHIQQLDWTHGEVNTRGQYQDIPVARLLKLWRNDVPVAGKLLMNAAWQVDIGQQISGSVQIQRTSGDLTVQDALNGHSQSIALGLQNLMFKASIGEHDLTELAGQRQISVLAEAKGDQLGLINLNLQTSMHKSEQGWALPDNAPVSGEASMQIKDIAWMSQLMGPGINLRGELDADAHFNGVVGKPQYQAKINGKELQLSFSELGILLPHGVLDASLDGTHLTLNTLKFSETIKPPPRHEGLNDLRWLSETGFIESSGQVDLATGRGAISTKWQKFPLMQNPQSWLVASGQAQLAESEKTWNLTGQLLADAAYFSVPKQAAPRLSSDVVVLKSNAKRSNEKSDGIQSSLDFSIGTGKNFIFVGRGIDTRLDGDIRIRSKNGGSILATGSIQTVGGTYEGYGQQLAIDRGILNFQGPIDNPGLNVRAIRRGLPVEAGVEVDGTVAKPVVHLISEPNVPDPDKLSWMVLGRPSDQMAGSEATLLMSAAGAIFGGDNGSNIPTNIAHSLGLEDVTFGTTSTSPESQLPTQTVAGTINTTAPNDQVFSVGKRIAPNIVFSIERSLTDASNGLKLTWHLTRRFSIIGRAGSDTAIDGQYTISFD